MIDIGWVIAVPSQHASIYSPPTSIFASYDVFKIEQATSLAVVYVDAHVMTSIPKRLDIDGLDIDGLVRDDLVWVSEETQLSWA